MKTNGFSFLILILLSACASHQAAPPNAPLLIPADIAGIVHAGRTNSKEEYALLDRLGADWTLLTFNWNRIEPAEGQWNFDYYDEFTDTAKAASKKIIAVLGYDVPWIHKDGKRHYFIPQDKLDFFVNYVRQVTAHFRGRVDAWCIWNEPNGHFWKGSREEFFELTRLAADVVQETDPDVILLGGAFNRGIFGLPVQFIRGLFESGAMEKVDAVAFHPYELNPERTAKLYSSFRAIAADYGFAGRIWITEVGYPTGGLYPTAVPEKKLPAFVVKTFVNLAVSGAQKILWYQLFDPPNRVKTDSEDFFGLLRSREDFTSKGAEAFRLCALHIAGTVYRPDLPLRNGLPHSLRAFYFEKPEGGGALVLWKEGSPLRVTLHGLADVYILHDLVSRGAAPLLPDTLTVGSMPVFVTWQGGGENTPVLRMNSVR